MGAESSKESSADDGKRVVDKGPSQRIEDDVVVVEQAAAAADVDDDEPDEWDKRIFSTGCSDEQTRLNDCYFEKKDWRKCNQEMQAFRECWARKGNNERTSTKDV